MPDAWSAGQAYDEFMGRWSRQLAVRFVAWLGAPPGLHWLDVGCGTGAMTEAIVAHASPASVIGCDPSAPFIDLARSRVTDPRVTFVNAGIGHLPRRPGGFGAVTSLLALNFFPDTQAALGELRTIAEPGSSVSACVWDYAGGMGFLRRFWDAAAALDAAALDLDEGARFPVCQPDALAALFLGADLGEVRVAPIEITTTFATFEDYWRPFLGGTGPAPSYVAGLDAPRRGALVRELAARVPTSRDGSIALPARAWAVVGRVE